MSCTTNLDTVWGRTVEGDEEVSVPKSGLSLVQRRVLRELAQPRTFAAIAAKHKMEAPKLENGRSGWPSGSSSPSSGRGAPSPRPHRASTCPIPRRPPPTPKAWQRPPLPVCLLAVFLGLCSVLLILT
jgi:hypothetical protein